MQQYMRIYSELNKSIMLFNTCFFNSVLNGSLISIDLYNDFHGIDKSLCVID